MAATMSKILATLFGTFSQANDVNRIEVYARVLKDVPLPILEKAVYKVITEWTKWYVPPPAVILEAARSLYDTQVPVTRVKTWEEAWHEINAAMYSTPWGKVPKWTTLEIKAAVDAYGWENLHTALEKDMPTIRAQIRRFYEDACNRISTTAHNEFVLGKNPKGILGLPMYTNGLEPVGHIE